MFQINKITGLFTIILFLMPSLVMASELVLKDGRVVDGNIIEKTDKYITLDNDGLSMTYYFDDIASIDGLTMNVHTNSINKEHIQNILEHLGYPKNTWSDIEQGLNAFLSKIDFPRLKQEATQVKSNPKQLKNLVSKLGILMKQEGFTNSQSPRPLMKLLVNGLGDEDIFQVIETSTISSKYKKKLRKDLTACSAVTQLGSILLESLGINVKAAFVINQVEHYNHAFNYISLNDNQILLMDFLNEIFGIIDLNQYYKLEGKYYVLKDEFHISPEKERKIIERGTKSGITTKEFLNCLYPSIYKTDDYAATSGIYCNRGDIYYRQGNLSQAISDYTKALEMDPDLADVHVNRGVAYAAQGNFAQAISDYNKAIEIYPDYDVAYFSSGNTYNKQGKFTQAIFDYTKAIEKNPDYAEAYFNRAVMYCQLKEYDNAWTDLYKAEKLGVTIVPKFLDILKQRSGRDQ